MHITGSAQNVSVSALSIKDPECHGMIFKKEKALTGWKRMYCILKVSYLTVILSIHTYIYRFNPSIYSSYLLFIHPSIYLSTHPLIHLSIHSYTHPLIYPSIHVYPSIYQSIHSFTPFIQLFTLSIIHSFIHPFIYPSFPSFSHFLSHHLCGICIHYYNYLFTCTSIQKSMYSFSNYLSYIINLHLHVHCTYCNHIVNLFVHPSIFPSIHPSPIHPPSIHASIHLSINPSIHSFIIIHPSIYLSIHLSIHPSIHPSHVVLLYFDNSDHI